MRGLILCLLAICWMNFAIAQPYERPPHIEEKLWNSLTPYFLPENSPQRSALDSIFKKHRAIKSSSAMRRAGFLLISPSNKIVVARHYKLRGYLLKVYLDGSTIQEWTWWKKRIDGARVIGKSIKRHGYEDIMKVPKKWIYPLPAGHAPKSDSGRRNFVLLVEDMLPLFPHKNHKAYKRKMTPELLDALYTILTENLLIDSVYADNVPFCEDGKLAFLDTEHALNKTRPVPLSTVGHYLSKDMRPYWEQLIVHGLR